MAYLWTKTFHLVFVMAWMGTVFYLPRILVNLAEAGDQPEVRARLLTMGQRLYKFGHSMFGVAFVLGMTLWLYFRIDGGWLHAKLVLVLAMLVYYVVCGRLLKAVAKGGAMKSPTFYRWFNEAPLPVLIGIVFLVLAKPF
jgi:putative membrane protein